MITRAVISRLDCRIRSGPSESYIELAIPGLLVIRPESAHSTSHKPTSGPAITSGLPVICPTGSESLLRSDPNAERQENKKIGVPESQIGTLVPFAAPKLVNVHEQQS